MKNKLRLLAIMIMIAMLALSVASCGDKNKEEDKQEAKTEAATETATEPTTQATLIDPADIVTTIEPDSEENLGKDIPLQIQSVTLYKDGSIVIVPTDDLKKNELADSSATSIMPFSESGEAKELYLLKVGSDGYRVIIALMEDGTISAVNTLALIKDHIAVVMDNLAGRDNFIGIEQGENEEGFSIIGKTQEGDEVVLDPVLLSDQARQEAEPSDDDEDE